jgi:hypothetical protein
MDLNKRGPGREARLDVGTRRYPTYRDHRCTFKVVADRSYLLQRG